MAKRSSRRKAPRYTVTMLIRLRAPRKVRSVVSAAGLERCGVSPAAAKRRAAR